MQIPFVCGLFVIIIFSSGNHLKTLPNCWPWRITRIIYLVDFDSF